MRILLIILILPLAGCSTAENDVIDQAIAARIYNRQGAAPGKLTQ